MAQEDMRPPKGRAAQHLGRRIGRWLMAALSGGALLAAPALAHAQARTFYLDRLQIPGAPDDGMVLFRPVTQPQAIFFGQLAMGYSYDPLRMSTLVNETPTLKASAHSVIEDQLTLYPVVGVQFLNRFTLSLGLPFSPWQQGQNPNYQGSLLQSGVSQSFIHPAGPVANDMRFDARAVAYRTPNRRFSVGGQISLFVPTGSTDRFGGDGSLSALFQASAEYDLKWLVIAGQMGIQLRPENSLNDAAINDGIGVSDEWRWAVGAFVPLKNGKYRIGLNIWGQTGIRSDQIVGDTFFRLGNTPLEWSAEGRMKFGPSEHWWTGVSAGTLIVPGYGAPDFRAVASIGTYVILPGSSARSPEVDKRMALRERWRDEEGKDTDGDGIPDDIDGCPTEAEDHKGSEPDDGCPAPPDRDNDGVPDQYDKCPDQPEDKDGVDDGDGCPEVDADNDGIPDTQDACPKQPGQRSADPKKNGCPQFISMEGGVIKITQQVHFATGSSKILPDSFPMLQEIANVLKVNTNIQRMAVEGHTDNRGAAAMNRRLSQARAESVVRWLAQHGIAAGRLEAHGYGPDRPIATNSTAAGRQANRRVEFKILKQTDTNQVQKN